MAQFNYYLKTTSDDRETNINLRITSNGKSVFLYTGLKVKRVFWCNDKNSQNHQRVMSTRLSRNANEINTEFAKEFIFNSNNIECFKITLIISQF